MAYHGSAAKRHRQSEKRRLRNRTARSKVRTATKRFLSAVEAKDKDAATVGYKELTKLLDTAAGKGIYHKNNAARKKSRLHARLAQLHTSEA